MRLLVSPNISVPTNGTRTHVIQRRRRQLGKALTVVLFLLPSLALFGVFVFIPVIEAAHYSLYDWNGFGPLETYIGFTNYVTLFQDPVFQGALKNNLTIAALSVCLQLPLALFLALLMQQQKMPGRTFFRTVFFLPVILSEIVAGLIWSFIYNPSSGLLAGLLHQINPQLTPPAYLANNQTVLFAIFIAMTWKYFGYHFVLYVTALQNIPAEFIEAARIDGASGFRIIRHITLPLLGSTIRLSAFFAILGSLQYFDLIFIMSNGGPAHASETMATYQIHTGLQAFQMGYGSAVGVVLFALCFIFALFYQRLVMKQDLAGHSAM